MSSQHRRENAGMGKNIALPTERAPAAAGINAEELRVRLRSIIRNEQASCHLMRLELAAAFAIAKPDEGIQRRVNAVLTALTRAERAYDVLLADLAHG